MSDDHDPDSFVFAALVVVACVLGWVLISAGAALWRMFG